MSVPVIVVLVVIALLVISVIAWVIAIKNNIIRFEQDVQNSASRIDVYLTKRFDCLTKMVDSVKGYTKHEEETLTKIIAMRNPGKNASMADKAQFENQMTQALSSLNMVVEQYPNLKADQLFLRLQNEISTVEDDLQAARSNYNSIVSHFNKYIKVFPNSMLAGAYKPFDYFEAEESKRQDVKIEF